MPRSYEDEVKTIIKLITGKKLSRLHPTYSVCLGWLGFPDWPSTMPEELKTQLFAVVCASYSVEKAQLLRDITAGAPTEIHEPAADLDDEEELRSLLPKGGWFEWYDEYTRQTEAPLSFHINCSLVALGAAIGRRAWLPRAHWKIYPNYSAILIGPTGRVHKSTAVGIAERLVSKLSLCPIMADKLTPEAFVNALQRDGGHQFIPVPEFAVLFNKQRYNDGFVTQILRMMDCPDVFKVETVMRGIQEVHDVALSLIGGSTMSLLLGNSPSEVTSSGFLNRFIMVVENDNKRCIPEPFKPKWAEEKLLECLKFLQGLTGEFSLTEETKAAYDAWYRTRHAYLRNAPSEHVAEVLQRAPDHLLRTAMLVHAVQCGNQRICLACFESAVALMKFLEKRMPALVSAISQTAESHDANFILSTIERLGGAADHSTLLRRISHRINAQTLKRHMTTLIETHQVIEKNQGKLKFYVIKNTEVKS